jgi:branched-chain amino acid transport system permease protein
MSSQDLLLPLFNGLSQGMLLFLVAAGLSLVFGILGVLNFAHAGFFMIGAYVADEIARSHVLAPPFFILVVLTSGVIVTAIGVLCEIFLFKPMYQRNELNFLLLSFGLLLAIEGAVRRRYGNDPHSLPQPKYLDSSITILGARIPDYSIFIIIAGVVVVVVLVLLLARTPYGRIINAVAEDRLMAGVLGINVAVVYTAVFALGIFLAGIGGGLIAPYQAIQPGLGALFVVESFVVVVVGGLDSVPGALLAAVLLGWLNSFLVVYQPTIAEFSLYLGMAVVLLVRPQGLLGRRLIRR